MKRKIEKNPKYNNVRICYGLKDGKMDYSEEIYEMNKYCTCNHCNYRLTTRTGSRNRICISTKDKSELDKMAEYIKKWQCNERRRVKDVYLKF